MQKYFKKLLWCWVSCTFLCLSIQARAWTMTQDCEGGAVNTLPVNTSTSYWGTNSRYSAEQFASGKQSCKFSIAKGSEGWPSAGGPLEWGAIFPLPAAVPVGKEVWMRLRLFVPNGFQIVSNSGMLKFMRLHTRTATTNNGCLDFLFGTGLPLWNAAISKDVYPQHIVSWEGAPALTFIGDKNKSPVTLGAWETYEVYVKVDTVSKAKGGGGQFRAWKNNILIADVPTQVSAADSTGVIDSLYVFTYWNGTSPQTQSLYMDDLKMTTDIPSNRDANGYPFIGGTVANNAGSPPQSPSNVSVTVF